MTLILKVQNNNLIVKQKILNLGPKIIDAAVWSLTQFAANGTAIFKFNNHNTGFLPNRKLIIWPYTNLNDPRLFLGDEYASLKMDPKNNRPLKLGMDSRIGRVSYILKNYQLIINYPNLQNANYPDFGCNLETYTNNYFLELETLSPLCKLLQGKSMTHNEI
jgi:hypothetical protein